MKKEESILKEGLITMARMLIGLVIVALLVSVLSCSVSRHTDKEEFHFSTDSVASDSVSVNQSVSQIINNRAKLDSLHLDFKIVIEQYDTDKENAPLKSKTTVSLSNAQISRENSEEGKLSQNIEISENTANKQHIEEDYEEESKSSEVDNNDTAYACGIISVLAAIIFGYILYNKRRLFFRSLNNYSYD